MLRLDFDVKFEKDVCEAGDDVSHKLSSHFSFFFDVICAIVQCVQLCNSPGLVSTLKLKNSNKSKNGFLRRKVFKRG